MRSVESLELSTLDYVFSLLSNRKTLLDFAFVLHFPRSLSIEALELGARSARDKFPITNSFLYRRRWEHIHTNNYSLEVSSTETALEAFINEPFNLLIGPPYRQLLITKPTGSILATRFHHAAADGLSAAMWLSHQLQVAAGDEAPVASPVNHVAPVLKHRSPSVWRSKFAYSTPSHPLKTCTAEVSNQRCWRSFSFEAKKLKQLTRRAGGFSYSDLLAACALEVLIEWNTRHKELNAAEVGLWLPINIRRETCSGFGNGTSRIRIYPRYERKSSIVEKAREVRRQIQWCTENGEWVVPDVPALRSLPARISVPLINAYLSTRYVDMGTAVFSHGDSWAGGVGTGLQTASRIECVGLLQKRQRLAINGTTHRGETCLTLTYDSGLFCADAVTLLGEMYLEQIHRTHHELANA